MEDKKIIKDMRNYITQLCKDLYKENGYTREKVEELITVTYYFELNFDGYIKFQDEKELRKNSLFILLYDKLSDKYKKLIDKYIKTFEYRDGNKNRGYRKKDKHFDIEILENFYGYSDIDLDIVELIQGKKYYEVSRDYKFYELFAVEFMENKKLIELFKGMVYENENVQEISHNLIIGAIVSNNKEVIQAVFDLLKAAKLSEGLRSSIVNYIDYGSLETYKMFLEYIRTENLTRFSSVKEAFTLFTGLQYYIDSDTKCPEYVLDCILDNKTEEYLKDENPLKVYVALYTISCIDFDKALDYVYKNYEKERPHIRLCFNYFLRMASEKIDSKVITYALKNEEDTSIKAGILSGMPKVIFHNNNDKKEFVKTLLNCLKDIKPKTKYYIFVEINKVEFNPTSIYNDILEYVEEIDDLYEEAYELFGKYSLVRSIYRMNKGKYNYLNEIKHPAQRSALIKGLSSTLSDVRKDSFEILKSFQLDFTEDEYMEMAKQLKSKRSDLRNNICSFFKKAEPTVVLKASKYLLEQKKDELKNGGLSILVDNLEKVQGLDEFNEIKDSLKEKDFAHEVLALKDTLLGESIVKKEEEKEVIELDIPTLTWDNELVEKITKFDFNIINNLMDKWYDKFLAHKDEEFEHYIYDGSKKTEVIGKSLHFVDKHSYGIEKYTGDATQDVKNEEQYKCYTFYKEFIGELDNFSNDEFSILLFMNSLLDDYIHSFSAKEHSWKSDYEKMEIERFDYYIENGILPKMADICQERNQLFKYKVANFNNILNCLYYYGKTVKGINFYELDSYNKILLNHLAFNVEFFKTNMDKLPECFTNKENLIVPFLPSENILDKLNYFDDEYAFNILSNLLSFYDKEYSPVDVYVYFYFLEKGLLSRDYLVSKLLNPSFKSIQYNLIAIIELSRGLRYAKISETNVFTRYKPFLNSMRDVQVEVMEKMLDVELQRTDSETKYTKLLNKTCIFFGVDTFAKCLDKMKKIDFVRGYGYSSTLGIKDIFSQILATTVPEEDLTDDKFEKVIKSYKITDKKVLEASLYNPYFTKFGSTYLNIKGLEKAMYYFKAHSLDYADNVLDETKKMINRYSEFELEDFVDGKMDIKWFKEIQEELSEEDYKKVYDASKFIMDTSKRKRGQYFSDAVLGHLDIKEVEEKINDKRNQDMLLCFGLIPLETGEAKEKEAVRRFKRIQQFLKESKQFGAQRRATEARRSSIALSNLATNYGVDVNRFTWIMEAKLIDEVKEVFEPKVIEDIEVYLSLENVRNPEIIVNKNGKKLKSIPSKYGKDENIVKIKEVKKDIKNQYSRGRETLENSMSNSDIFTLEELELINTHPVVKEIVKDVLFISDGFIGFLKNNELVNFNNETYKLTKKSKVRIAHCVDLFENDWAKWQSYVMENEIVQPFKQVFRELYTLTDEELANDGYTNRFAGYQIEGRKALGVLSSRNWVLNDYDGFEKVNHAHNLRIDLYCYANWRNANELEDETLEKITFINNKTNKTMDMKNLDKVLFSETMRDLDLVVSVAYVGGVDPLLNHTTLEMRKRILTHNLNLFKLKNYKFTDKHILIEGSLQKYSIHLGSGVVNVEGRGMLPMTPVLTQRRGHIFLPFVDEDPKTSEIITKVLMLAEDDKLKDPTILKYLR